MPRLRHILSHIYTVAGVAVFVALIAGAVFVCLRDGGAVEKRNTAKRYQKTLAEGVVVNRHGVYGIDFLKVGETRIEKVRKGPLTFGAYNALVLSDLELVIPLASEGDGSSTATGRAKADHDSSPEDIMSSFAFLTADGASFSSVKIKGLAVSRQTADGVEPLFTARGGATGRDALELDGCIILAGGVSNAVHDARIRRTATGASLEWRGGTMPLDPLSNFAKSENQDNKENET